MGKEVSVEEVNAGVEEERGMIAVGILVESLNEAARVPLSVRTGQANAAATQLRLMVQQNAVLVVENARLEEEVKGLRVTAGKVEGLEKELGLLKAERMLAELEGKLDHGGAAAPAGTLLRGAASEGAEEEQGKGRPELRVIEKGE